jgi:hypothetical protein
MVLLRPSMVSDERCPSFLMNTIDREDPRRPGDGLAAV